MSRKNPTAEEIKNRIRKRGSYSVNVTMAQKLRGYGVRDEAIYPILVHMHHLKRYSYKKNVIYAMESIELIKSDLENKTLIL